MKKETTENKEPKIESKPKKSSYSKKKKGKKNILNGIAYVQSTFNNTIVSIADTNGNVVSLGHLLAKKVLKDQESLLHMLHRLLPILLLQKR